MNKDYQALYRYVSENKEAIKWDASKDVCVCMLSKSGKAYHVLFPVTADDATICSLLTDTIPESDRAVSALVCFMEPWGLDIPGYAFKKALIQIDPANEHAVIYAQGKDDVVGKELRDTMPPVAD